MDNGHVEDPFKEPIIVSGCRILRPKEIKLFLTGIPKNSYKTAFLAVFACGMRFSEFQEFQNHPKWFNEAEEKIFLPSTAIKKKKVIQKQRWIHLSPFGTMMISNFLNGKVKLPDRRTWLENLIRWAEKAEMDTEGISIKMTRKTLECWLITFYQNNIIQILLNMGHTEKTAINHYLSQPFTKQDVDDMKMYIEGWL